MYFEMDEDNEENKKIDPKVWKPTRVCILCFMETNKGLYSLFYGSQQRFVFYVLCITSDAVSFE